MSMQAENHLMEQMLDVTALPHMVAYEGADSMGRSFAMSRALSNLAGHGTELTLGGLPADMNWKSMNKLSIQSIKSLDQLEERLSDLRSGKTTVEGMLLGQLTSVLRCSGYEESSARDWATVSIICMIGCLTQ